MKFTQPLFPISKQINPLNVIMVMLMLMLNTAQAQTEAAPKVDKDTQQAIKQVQQFMEFEMPKILEIARKHKAGDPNVQALTFYQANANGTVTDKVLKLIWMRCSLGQTWTGRSCDGKAKKYAWGEAKQIAKKMHFAGHSDWRLPTIEELKSLVYCSNGVDGDGDGYRWCVKGSQIPTLFQSLFPNTPAEFYWSTSLIAKGSDAAWGVHFGYGYDYYYYYRYFSFHVRLVRSGQ